MDSKIAAVSILVSDRESAEQLNDILHRYGDYIIGRMGIPYRAKGVNIICVAVDAPMDVINALTGKIGNLPGVSVKTACAAQ